MTDHHTPDTEPASDSDHDPDADTEDEAAEMPGRGEPHGDRETPFPGDRTYEEIGSRAHIEPGEQADPDDPNTPANRSPDHAVSGIDENWSTDASWNGHHYNEIPVPDENDRAKHQWATEERRAYLLSLVREYGHPDNVPYTQTELGEQFGVAQQAIHRDYKELRQYIRFHTGNRAISTTQMVAEKAVKELQRDGDHMKALNAQLKYDDWLFDLGRLQREPDRKQVESVNISADADDLDDDERAKIDQLAEMMGTGGDGAASAERDDDVIDVDATTVDDAEDDVEDDASE